MFDSTHKLNIEKTRKTINPTLDTKKVCVCVCQNISLRRNRDKTKNRPEVGKAVLLIQEIL